MLLFYHHNIIPYPLPTGVYTTFVMLMNTWSVMLTVLVLNLHHRNQRSHKSPPPWLKKFVFSFLARLLFMYSKAEMSSGSRKDSYSRKYREYEEAKHSRHKVERERYKMVSTGGIDSGKRGKGKAGYSLHSAAAQFSGRLATSPLLFPNNMSTAIPHENGASCSQMHPGGGVPGGAGATGGTGTGGTPATGYNYNSRYNNPEELRKLDYECLLQNHHEQRMHMEHLHEWRLLAKVVDRMFFWLTLMALISVSVGMFCLLWTRENKWPTSK